MDRKTESILDARALHDIRLSPGFGAILRLLQKKKDDLFTDWASDKDLSKDYCKGALAVIESFVSDVDQMIEYGHLLEQQEREAETLTRGRGLDGGGTGDLAV